jgi:predicted acylesterase/phospholipase RssA
MIGLENLPRPPAYVLGGGGSLGTAQVGMLKALDGSDSVQT